MQSVARTPCEAASQTRTRTRGSMLQCLTSPAWPGSFRNRGWPIRGCHARVARVLIRTHRIPNRTRVHNSGGSGLRTASRGVGGGALHWGMDAFDVCKHSKIALCSTTLESRSGQAKVVRSGLYPPLHWPSLHVATALGFTSDSAISIEVEVYRKQSDYFDTKRNEYRQRTKPLNI
jgi:hypothetical protein